MTKFIKVGGRIHNISKLISSHLNDRNGIYFVTIEGNKCERYEFGWYIQGSFEYFLRTKHLVLYDFEYENDLGKNFKEQCEEEEANRECSRSTIEREGKQKRDIGI